MIGMFVLIIGIFVTMFGMSIDGFDDPNQGRMVRRYFILFGLIIVFIGLLIASYTI